MFSFVEFSNDYFPGTGTFDNGRTSVSVVIQVAWDDLNDALITLLGFSTANGTSLSRQLPLAHPYFPQMYCTRVDNFQPYAFDKTNSPANAQDSESQLPQYTQYQFVRMHAYFEPMPYKIIPDGGIGGDEFNRYVSRKIKPRGEAVTLTAGLLGYNFGNQKTPVSIPAAKRLTKADITWIWHQIPAEGIFGADGVPSNQLDLLGTTNKKKFEGYDPNTLLLTNVELSDPYCMPAESDPTANQASVFYDMTFTVLYYAPAFDDASGYGDHTYIPCPNPVGGTAAPKGYAPVNWKAGSTYTGLPLYAQVDWNDQLFVINE